MPTITRAHQRPHRPRRSSPRARWWPPNGAEALATIQQLDPIYADFTQSATDLIRLRRAMQAGAVTPDKQDEAAVKLLMDDGSAYPHAGRLLFSEATVDAGTGQVTLRGEFPNPNGDLLPGMYVRVLIEQGIQPGAIVVPQQAIQRDTAGRAQLYVVKPDDTVERCRVVRTSRVARHQRRHRRGAECRATASWSTASRSCAAGDKREAAIVRPRVGGGRQASETPRPIRHALSDVHMPSFFIDQADLCLGRSRLFIMPDRR